MNATTSTFIARVNEYCEVGIGDLVGKPAVEHFRLGLEQLEAHNAGWFVENGDEVELTDEQWAEVIKGVQVARGFAVVAATDEDNL